VHGRDLSTNDNQTDGNEPLIDIDEIKGMVEEQKRKIEELIKTIDSLEISSTDTEKLKLTIHDFAHSSQEMMGCIAILEEENERLKANEENASNTIDNVEDNTKETQDNSGVDALNSTISNLEEEAIKKDVAFAQLQDEFSSMETEYLAMYEAMHGDNSIYYAKSLLSYQLTLCNENSSPQHLSIRLTIMLYYVASL